MLFVTPAAASDPLQVTLVYEMPVDAGCPDDLAFRARVAHRLGYDPFRAEARFHVAVRATPTEAGPAGRVEWHDDAHAVQGDQAFPAKGRDCPRLTEEMAFALAVQIQLLGIAAEASPAPSNGPHEGEPAPAPAPAPPAPPATSSPPLAHAADASPAAPTTPWLAVGAGPAVDFGFAPTVTASARLSVELHYGYALVQVGGDVAAPTTRHESDGSGFREYALAGDLGLCGAFDCFALCGLGSLGRVWVTGFGVDQPGTESGLVARAGLRLRVSQSLGPRFALGLHADGTVLLTPWNVALNGIPVWSLPTFAAAVGLDVTARFP